jgi:hypothetical protein
MYSVKNIKFYIIYIIIIFIILHFIIFYIFNIVHVTCNMKYLGNGALDTSLKYIWTFSIVSIFIHMYNVSKVPSSLGSVRNETLYVWINIETMEKVQTCFGTATLII